MFGSLAKTFGSLATKFCQQKKLVDPNNPKDKTVEHEKERQERIGEREIVRASLIIFKKQWVNQ
jgi:hypothetical protein